MTKKLILIIFLILVTLSSVIYAVYYWRGLFGSPTRAKTGEYSIDNSYIFISPLKAQADGIDKIRVTIYVLNGQGLGVSSRHVSIETDSNLKIDPIQPVTDETGKAAFDITTTRQGEYKIEAKVESEKLKQTAKARFN